MNLFHLKILSNIPPKFSIRKVSDKVFHIVFDCKKDLGLTFLRFQEFYESPKFKGRFFTLDDYYKWYVMRYNSFSYCEDFEGYNLPSAILKYFKEGHFDPLTKKELALLKEFAGLKGDFCIIGTVKNARKVFKHEYAHALFYTNPKYKAEVLEILKTVRLTKLFSHFKKIGYHKSVFLDEAQAYILANLDYIQDEAKINPENFKAASRKLNKLYAKYSKDRT